MSVAELHMPEFTFMHMILSPRLMWMIFSHKNEQIYISNFNVFIYHRSLEEQFILNNEYYFCVQTKFVCMYESGAVQHILFWGDES